MANQLIMRAWAVAAVSAVVLGLSGAPVAARPAAPHQIHPTVSAASSRTPHPKHLTERLRRRGLFVTDSAGRDVILHGVNLVYKLKPFVAAKSHRGFTARDARFMTRYGINAVRLGVLFQGVMPRPGHIDQQYLRRVNRIVKLLTAHHIWVLIDFHQDAFSQKFAGEGFPAWAVHDDGLPFVNFGSFFLNDQTPAVQAAYDHFWNNDDRLWAYYDQAWRAVARRWRHQPYLMGYDLFNEPNAGSQMSTCANPAGCPIFDATLQRMQTSALHAIRSVDKRHIVWFEPQFLFNAISQSNFTHVNDREIGLSWHDYACTPAFVSGGVIPGNPDCTINEPRVMDNATTQAKTMGAASVMTEFGAEDDVADLARLTKYADQHLDGWLYWAFKTWNDPTGSSNEGLFSNDRELSSAKRAKLKTLFHPYPQAIAGTPTSITWTPGSRTLTFRYVPRRTSQPTVVVLPPGFYPHGYRVHVVGGHRGKAGRHRVIVRAKRHSRSVKVSIKPRH